MQFRVHLITTLARRCKFCRPEKAASGRYSTRVVSEKPLKPTSSSSPLLSGHEAGAFTGAQKRHPGRFERADGGTLFLDELATAPMLVQEKLLRVIEYGELERVGGSQPLQVNVRLVCATNANLPERVAEETFRDRKSVV